MNILSPLGLTPIQGQLDGTLTLLRSGDRQNVRLVAGGRDLSAGSDLSLGAFDADVSASDLLGRPVLDGRLTADRLTAGGETFDQIRLTANGAEGASDLKLAATARAFQPGSRRPTCPGEQTRIDLDLFTARRGDQRFALAGPASITIEGRSAVLSNLVVTTGGGGRVSLKGTVGEQFNLAVSAQSIPLSIAEILRPGVGLAGTLAGAASLHGDLARPEGSYQLSVSCVVTPRTRGAGSASDRRQRKRYVGRGRCDAGRQCQRRRGGRAAGDGASALAVGRPHRASDFGPG